MIRTPRVSVALLVGAAIAWAVVGARSVWANDVWVSEALPLSVVLFGAVVAVVVVGGYALVTVAVEAWVLGPVLDLGLRQAFGCSALANIASGAVGAAWWALGRQAGWNTAMTEGEWGLAGMHILRSFLVTLAVEAAILILLLRRQVETDVVLRGVVWANAVSYFALLAPLIAVLALASG